MVLVSVYQCEFRFQDLFVGFSIFVTATCKEKRKQKKLDIYPLMLEQRNFFSQLEKQSKLCLSACISVLHVEGP